MQIYTAIRIDKQMSIDENMSFFNNNDTKVLVGVDMQSLKEAVRARIQRFKDEVWLLSSPQQVGQIKTEELPPVKFDPA